MNRQNEPLDRLIREALGSPSNPAPARRACRAALRVVATAERRRARQRVVWQTTAVSLALVGVLANPLGSESFDVKVTEFQKNGHAIRVFEHGVRGESFGSLAPGAEGGLTDAEVANVLQEEALGNTVPSDLYGWHMGRKRYIWVLGSTWTGERATYGQLPVEGYSSDFPRWLKDLWGPSYTNMAAVEETCERRGPDFTVPMTYSGVIWIVDGWRVRLPGFDEIVYYHGRPAAKTRSGATGN